MKIVYKIFFVFFSLKKGYNPNEIKGSKTGVFISMGEILGYDIENGTAVSSYKTAANQVAYFMGLDGNVFNQLFSRRNIKNRLSFRTCIR